MKTVSAQDPRFQVPAAQPSRPKPRFKAPLGPDRGVSSLQEDSLDANVEHVRTEIIIPSEEDAAVRNVIGIDDRTRITATTSYPWNTVCFVEGTWGPGTGVLISPYCVLSAGHIVYDQGASSWADADFFEVVPAQYEFSEVEDSIAPYGEYVGAADLRSNSPFLG